jgi:hypothetical protein
MTDLARYHDFRAVLGRPATARVAVFAESIAFIALSLRLSESGGKFFLGLALADRFASAAVVAVPA